MLKPLKEVTADLNGKLGQRDGVPGMYRIVSNRLYFMSNERGLSDSPRVVTEKDEYRYAWLTTMVIGSRYSGRYYFVEAHGVITNFPID